MPGWFAHLRERWNNWCGDRDMEIAIRKHLTELGYYGGTAKLKNVRLVAVQRPGWLQIYRFEAESRVRHSDDTNREPEYRLLYGLVRDDIRSNTNVVQAYESSGERIKLFAQWSEGLICLRGAQGLGSGD